jgi:hypothetical protein
MARIVLVQSLAILPLYLALGFVGRGSELRIWVRADVGTTLWLCRAQRQLMLRSTGAGGMIPLLAHD